MAIKQSGFALVEGLIVSGILVFLVVSGYAVWHYHQPKNTTRLGYSSPAVSTGVVPQITSSSGLNSALKALNQIQLSASNTDSVQLNSQASGF